MVKFVEKYVLIAKTSCLKQSNVVTTDSIADGLAIDVRRKLLFIADSGHSEIAWVDYSDVENPTVPSTIYALLNAAGLEMENPRDIELDVIHRLQCSHDALVYIFNFLRTRAMFCCSELYFTNWGDKGYIARASYDGSGAKKIVSGLVWPNGITLDLMGKSQ